MRQTSWTKPISSSFPSDRIKPKPPPTSTPSSKSKGKGQQQQGSGGANADPPKSKAVRRLEHLLNELRTASLKERDPKGGCFCLARSHELSPYTPLCRSCGLILCRLNAPYHACPHCTLPLLASSSSPSASSSPTRESLITRLESELESTLAAEYAQQQRALEHARQAAGAFPQLHAPSLSSSPYGSPFHSNSPSPSPSPAPLHSLSPAGAAARMSAASAPPSRQTHKIMSLTGTPKGGKAGNTRRVVVSSYTTTTTPAASRPQSRNNNNNVDDLEGGIGPRVPTPSLEPEHAPSSAVKASAERPWQNLIHGPATYKPPTRLDDEGAAAGGSGAAGGGGTSRRRRNKGKGKDAGEARQAGDGAGDGDGKV